MSADSPTKITPEITHDELIRIRENEFPSLPPQHVFFNTAGGAPMCRSALLAASRVLEDMAEVGDRNFMQYLLEMKRTRLRIAGYISAEAEDDIAFAVNSSSAVAGAARVLRSAGVKRVFCPRYEFPTSTQALHALGFEVVFIGDNSPGTLPIDIEAALADAVRKVGVVDGKSALLASHVNYLSGECIDLAAAATACRTRDMLCCINATQSFGTLPINVSGGIDMLFGSGLKWAHAGFGTGFLYIRNALIAKYGLPKLTGWTSVENPGLMDNRTHNPVQRTKALDMGGGAPSFQTVLALGGALSLREQIGGGDIRVGVRRIAHRALSSAQKLRDRLEQIGIFPLGARGKPQRSGIVSIAHERAPAVCRFLEERGISTTLRRHPETQTESIVRFGVPFFTLDDEIERAALALEECLSEKM